MKESLDIVGKYGTAKVFANIIEPEAISQILTLLNHKAFDGVDIKIMPDVHAGAGCVIGFTGKFLDDKVIPNIVGVDIGCGMLTRNIGNIDIDLKDFDEYIHKMIPMGSKRNNNIGKRKEIKDFLLKALGSDISLEHFQNMCDRVGVDLDDALNSLGTLGGGNHFIEVDVNFTTGDKYIIIHSGSRGLGKRVAEWHQRKAERSLEQKRVDLRDAYNKDIGLAKQRNDTKLLKAIQEEYETTKILYEIPKQLSYLEGIEQEQYLSDMKVVQRYARANRELMMQRILTYFVDNANKKIARSTSTILTDLEEIVNPKTDLGFHTVHNYISESDNIVRKGAISATKNDLVLIPINMRDGCILGRGKGNANWNNSAPHGAGRLMSRSQAKAELKLIDFQETMKDVYSSTVNVSTLDEAPNAYKPIEDILTIVEDTVEILTVLKPIYNVKAVEIEPSWRTNIVSLTK